MSIEPPLPTEIQVDDEISLRRMFDTPAEEVHALVHRNMEHLGRFLGWATPDYGLEGVREFQRNKRAKWSKSEEQGYSIYFKDEYVGAIGMRGFDSPVQAASIGYWLSEHAQGSGVMTRSVAALIKLGFEAYDLNQVIIKAAPENIRSRAIPERLGFTATGAERQMAKNAKGEYLDLVTYSLLKSEWAG